MLGARGLSQSGRPIAGQYSFSDHEILTAIVAFNARGTKIHRRRLRAAQIIALNRKESAVAFKRCLVLNRKESAMDWNVIEGNWTHSKGRIKDYWGHLTDEDLDKIAGKRDQLEGKIQERYGLLQGFRALGCR